MIRLADDIHIWRRTYRMTQQEAADEVNVSLKTWQRWERGETYPGEDHYNSLRWIIAQPPAGWLARPENQLRTDYGEQVTEEGTDR